MKKKDIGIYVHIPFCKSKCYYCDFLSFSNKETYFKAYKDALISEILNFSELSNYNIKTIFIGGGTPTVLPPYFIAKILESIYKYDVDKNAEITIEANPENLKEDYLRQFLGAGINRISIGLQAWHEEFLNKLGRIHNLDTFLKVYDNAFKVGFSNINIDLIFSLPDSNFFHFEETIKNVSNLKPTHISLYGLTVEENTVFHNIKDSLNLPSDDTDRKMYYFAKDYLSKKGYFRYEISNFSKDGYECKHNNIYWKRESYKGFGLGAHSFLNEERTVNTKNLEKYITSDGNINNILEEIIKLSTKDSISEFMFLGLRLSEGVCKIEFKKIFNQDINDIFGHVIRKYTNSKCLEETKDRVFLTDKGIDISNTIMSEFLL